MPLYEVEYVISLSTDQKTHFAKSITEIHSQLFTTPSLFVNVRFTDVSHHDIYVGGKPRSTNRIVAHVRAGGDRSTSQFNGLCAKLTDSWDHTVNGGKPGQGNQELRSVFILGDIVAGTEAGFDLPPAGGDKKWIEDNLAEFRKRAEAGDTDFQDVLEEINSRDELRNLVKE